MHDAKIYDCALVYACALLHMPVCLRSCARVRRRRSEPVCMPGPRGLADGRLGRRCLRLAWTWTLDFGQYSLNAGCLEKLESPIIIIMHHAAGDV